MCTGKCVCVCVRGRGRGIGVKPLIFLEDNVRAVSIQETMCVLVSVCV